MLSSVGSQKTRRTPHDSASLVTKGKISSQDTSKKVSTALSSNLKQSNQKVLSVPPSVVTSSGFQLASSSHVLSKQSKSSEKVRDLVPIIIVCLSQVLSVLHMLDMVFYNARAANQSAKYEGNFFWGVLLICIVDTVMILLNIALVVLIVSELKHYVMVIYTWLAVIILLLILNLFCLILVFQHMPVSELSGGSRDDSLSVKTVRALDVTFFVFKLIGYCIQGYFTVKFWRRKPEEHAAFDQELPSTKKSIGRQTAVEPITFV